MKKILTEYKIFIIAGSLVIIFLAVLLWPENKIKKVEPGQTTKIVGIQQRPQGVDWSETKIEIPEKLPILKSQGDFINDEQINSLKQILGMNNANLVKKDNYYILYKDDDGKVLYVKLKEKQIDYQAGELLEYGGDKDPTMAINSFKELIERIVPDRQISSPKVDYFKDEYRAIRTNQATADFMEITSNFVVNNRPVMSYQGGPSIKAQYNFDGKLGRLIIFNPFDRLTEDKTVTLIKQEDIKNLLASDMPIFSIEGNRDFEMSSGEEAVRLIKSGESKIAYIYDPGKGNYQPFLVVIGKTNLESGEAKVTFGIPLVK